MVDTTYDMARGEHMLRLRDAREQAYALYESARINLSRIKQERKDANKIDPQDETLLKATKLELARFQNYMNTVRDFNHFVRGGKLPPETKQENEKNILPSRLIFPSRHCLASNQKTKY